MISDEIDAIQSNNPAAAGRKHGMSVMYWKYGNHPLFYLPTH